MLNDNAKKWVAALRDPNTKQIKGALETSEGRCVLGVLCRLYADEHPKWPVVTNIGIMDFTMFGSPERTTILPVEVMEWLCLNTNVGTYQTSEGDYHKLTGDNDEGGMSLPDLADLIESEPEGLFV